MIPASRAAPTQFDECPGIGTEFAECLFAIMLGKPKGASQLCPAFRARVGELLEKRAPIGQR
jgi:hypothetical protein